ncbi:helix-turn-helix domain-containing protein [Isoptericola sp. NPDC019693]|uniref:helix-turn-helix domain-containing protein n=1 Tax=Isoptericola sp. NPDC019693 TaxID=3364009 RepID=UPI0037BCB284
MDTTTTLTDARLIEADTVAALLHRHPVTVRKNLREGVIPGVKIGGRWYVSSRVLDRLLAGESVAALGPDSAA